MMIGCLIGKQLGAGAFGRVVKAEAIGLDGGEPATTVAVKMVRSHGNMIGLKALMSELKIMIHMGSHLNVVNLRGACTKNVTKGILAEHYCAIFSFLLINACLYRRTVGDCRILPFWQYSELSHP